MALLSHLDANGKAHMVDVGSKSITKRTASASITVSLNTEAFAAVKENSAAKGDVLAVANVAGIQAAKRTYELIPLCHQIPLEQVELSFDMNENARTIQIVSEVKCAAKTGAEMEALTACSVAALTVYDMLKAVQKDILISDLMLLKKSRGAGGDYVR
jgi:cyclic pyranopterin phosphate synthase